MMQPEQVLARYVQGNEPLHWCAPPVLICFPFANQAMVGATGYVDVIQVGHSALYWETLSALAAC